VPTARDFVPWRFSDAGHSARGWHRHAGVRETCTISDIRQAKYMGRIERASHPNAEEISQIRPLDCRPGCRRDGIRPCARFSCGKAGKL
jgi:hypothetical protein